MTHTHLATYLSLVTLAITASACTGDTPARTGQEVEPVSLSSTDAQGGVGGDVLAILAESSADGAVRVTAPSDTPSSNDVEGDVIDALRAGKADLSVIRSDRLATEGADSLATLQLPMLITSTEQADKVAADPIAEDLMASLDEIGLVGVALVPGGLRHPFGYNAPLYGPDDYRDHMFNSRPGAGVDAIFAALGATTDHSAAKLRSQGALSGALRGIEVSLQQQGAVDRPAVLTSNVTLYTKFDVVVVRRETWNGLTDAQRDALRTAAVAAGAIAIDERDSEVEGLDRWCELDGASSVTATPEQVDALRSALQPVVDTATEDGTIKRLVDRIAELGAGTEQAAGRACGATTTDTASGVSATSPGTSTETAPASTAANPSTSEPTYAVVPVGPQDVLDGVWRLDADREYMLSQGLSAQEAGANAGIWTLTIENGVADVDQPHGPNCLWQFAFDGDAISLNQGTPENDSCWGHMIGTYTLVDDVVRIHWDRNQDYDVVLDNAMFHDGMHKIG